MTGPGIALRSLSLIVAAACWGTAAATPGDPWHSVSASGRVLGPGAAEGATKAPSSFCTVVSREINLHQIDYAAHCLGLDSVTWNGSPAVSCTSNLDGKVFFADPDSGAQLDWFNLNAANSGAFGNHQWDGMFFNDHTMWYRYFTDTEGIGWTTFDNPAQDSGRGMDMDHGNGLVWETFSSTGLYAFGPTDSQGTYFHISAGMPGQMSGLTVFPHGTGTGIAVAFYLFTRVFFFEFTGTAVTYLDCADLPQANTVDESYGLTYSEARGTFFWSYLDASGRRYLSELVFSGDVMDLIFGDGFECGSTSAWSDLAP
jgi:hypothetical protein